MKNEAYVSSFSKIQNVTNSQIQIQNKTEMQQQTH